MTITKLLELYSTSCPVTQQQAQALDSLAQALQAFCEGGVEMPTAVVGAGLVALEQITNSRGEEDGQVSWRAFRMEAGRQTGSSLVAHHESGQELAMQLDAAGEAYIGSYNNLLAEGEASHAITFDLRSTSTGRLFRLLAAETTTEIILEDNEAGELHWTGQPDFGEELDEDEITEDQYMELSAASDEETDEGLKAEIPELDDDNTDKIDQKEEQ